MYIEFLTEAAKGGACSLRRKGSNLSVKLGPPYFGSAGGGIFKIVRQEKRSFISPCSIQSGTPNLPLIRLHSITTRR